MGLALGAYLKEPKTEKVSTDAANDRLAYGASSMQGWRISQEDAHNCLLDYDTEASFFAVYDGHGGHEVAQYCSMKLPDYIKDQPAYKEGNIEQALIEGFLGFDGTIVTEEVVAELKKIAWEQKDKADWSDDEDDEENLHEEKKNLYEEATMPISEILEKYKAKEMDEGKKEKKDKAGEPVIASSSSGSSAAPASSSTDEASSSGCSKVDSSENNGVSSSCGVEEEGVVGNSTNQAEAKSTDKIVSNGSDSEATSKEEENCSGDSAKNTTDSAAEEETVSTTTAQENGEDESPKKGKGKALKKTKGMEEITNEATEAVKRILPKRSLRQLYKTFLEAANKADQLENEDDDEDDSSDDDDDTTVNIEENSDSSAAEEEEDDDDDDDDNDDDDDDLPDDMRDIQRGPGSDSGCTAVVALLKGNELFVANAGDSRCIVCRDGTAIEMSFDHKPEDELERERIKKAGGCVSYDGRVDGGLNLSRAIGDHDYKKNKNLSDREQMITALPDVKRLTIGSQDEFMVLACDGIWNFMSSQEVVDFVRPRIEKRPDKLSQICEEMFDHCLAPNTMGDGTGCDNMTAIIVQFKGNKSLKRRANEDDDDANTTQENSETKRAKTESPTTSPAAPDSATAAATTEGKEAPETAV